MDSLRPACLQVACRTASAEKHAKTLRIERRWNCGLHGAPPGRLAICNRGRALADPVGVPSPAASSNHAGLQPARSARTVAVNGSAMVKAATCAVVVYP